MSKHKDTDPLGPASPGIMADLEQLDLAALTRKFKRLETELGRLHSRITYLEGVLEFMDMNDVTEYLDAQIFEISMSDLDKKILIQKRRSLGWADDDGEE